MHITALTLFPEFFDGPLNVSIPKRAIEAGLLRVDFVNPRDHATNVHRTVDDTPYGGGPGMVMRVPEVTAALQEAHARSEQRRAVVLLSPQGAPLTQAIVAALAQRPGLILVCGRYEGIDERFVTREVDHEISLGDFVLSGGEPAAFTLIDAIARLREGAVGNHASVCEESFQDGTLEHPHFTRPLDFDGDLVPEILRSGDHGKIARWRRKVSLLRTQARRADLWETLELSRADHKLLKDSRIEVDARWYEPTRSRMTAPPQDAEGEDAPDGTEDGGNSDSNRGH